MTRRCYKLTDHEWSILSPLLPNKPRGVARVDLLFPSSRQGA
jgi:transposase